MHSFDYPTKAAVPLLQLHGLQFKKVDGGTWQYKSMAQRILENLRL
jgi:hypothetical protein